MLIIVPRLIDKSGLKRAYPKVEWCTDMFLYVYIDRRIKQHLLFISADDGEAGQSATEK